MPYATLANLVERFGELELTQLTDAATPGLIDEAVVDRALADASALVDGYLGGRYTLPLVAVPPVLTGAVCDLARARLYKDVMPEVVKQRHEDALKYLTLLGQGKLTLGLVPEPASTNTAALLVADGERRRDGIGL